MRRLTTALLAALALAPADASGQQPEPRPTLVVFITVDQLRPDYFVRWDRQLTGGLGRMWRGGAFFTRGFQDHGVTETAPGHASTLSGRFPASTGIVGNAYGVADTQTRLVASRGYGASPFRFRGSTLIDWMRTADADSRALSLARKDRGAILPLGRAHQSVFWYDGWRGVFTTSTYYADTLPDWVDEFNARRIPQGMAGQVWTPLLDRSEYPEPDTVRWESANPYAGGRHEPAFPHPVPAHPDSAAKYFAEFPFMDQLTADAAIAGLRAMNLGRGPSVDLLAVSFSTTDAVGHRYGPDSRELHDQVLRVDRIIGAFMDSVYAQVDSSRVVFALTADHGVTPFPEVAFGDSAHRFHVSVDSIVTRLGGRASSMGAGGAAVEWDDGLLFVRRERLPAGTDVEALIAEFVTAARRVPGVMRVDRMRDLWALDSAALARDDVGRRWVHMIPPDQPIPVVVTLRPGAVWGPRSYAMHGSPHDIDAGVPIAFYGAGIRPGRHDTFTRVVDIGPTLARLIGVTPTERLDGRVLEQALR
jgi:predicted AlkP superfamily pyrophosphatase or phosphodiesterase